MLKTQQVSFVEQCLNHPLYKDKILYQTYKMSETILLAGSPICYFGIVIDGVLKAECYTINGNNLYSTYFENGDTFPEFLYFTENQVYTYSLVAARKSTIAWISIDIFEDMLKDSRLTYALLKSISQRGLKNQLLLNCLNYQLIQERVAYWIVGMHNIAQNDIIALPRSQTMWANTLHVSRSSLNQELKLMEKQGYFKIEGHKLIILNEDKLNELL